MIWIIIGASCSGKTSFIKNTWFGNSIGLEKIDLLPYTITSDAILLGKYIGIESRIVGCDKMSRMAYHKVGEQVKKLLDEYPNKDIVMDGDKITENTVLRDLIGLNENITLLLITCSKNVSIKRNEKHGYKNTSSLKATYTKSKNIFLRYKDNVHSAKFIITDDFKESDFKEFCLNTANFQDKDKFEEYISKQLSLF